MAGGVGGPFLPGSLACKTLSRLVVKGSLLVSLPPLKVEGPGSGKRLGGKARP